MKNRYPCPCEECICKSICRHKPYPTMFRSCSLVYSWMYGEDFKNKHKDVHYLSHRYSMRELCKVLKPTRWSIDEKFNIFSS